MSSLSKLLLADPDPVPWSDPGDIDRDGRVNRGRPRTDARGVGTGSPDGSDADINKDGLVSGADPRPIAGELDTDDWPNSIRIISFRERVPGMVPGACFLMPFIGYRTRNTVTHL